MPNYRQIIKKPLITEKTMQMLHEHNWTAFGVSRNANKIQIKAAIEKIFNVKVESVNIVNVKGKSKRFGKNVGKVKDSKKALVRLKEGDKIQNRSI
ncbi:MAG: 50S ribosomal protein L23 [Nitrospinales bacterium]